MTTPRRLRVFMVSATVAVAAAIVAGLLALGSPAEQRRLRLDQHRVRDLNAIAGTIDLHWRANKRLPETLDELRSSYRTAGRTDPMTGLAYEYRIIGGRDFELCAVFESESRADTGSWFNYSRNWEHGRGRHCFELNVQDAN